MNSDAWHLAAAIVPSILLCVAFIVVIRAMISGDRRERRAAERDDELGHDHVSRIPTQIDPDHK